jgi:hypothetical protein
MTEDDELCSICLDPHDVEQPRAWRTLDYRHGFHATCIEAWEREHNVCPLCMGRIRTETLAVPEAPALAVPEARHFAFLIFASILGMALLLLGAVLIGALARRASGKP